MSSSLIPQIFVFAFLAVASSQLAQRKREMDSAGNPSLRMWSLFLIGFVSGFFWLWVTLKNLGDPSHRLHPENSMVEAFFCVFGFLAAAWGYSCKITLNTAAVTYRLLPFLTRVYPIDNIETVESANKGSAIIRLLDGRKIAVLPLFSGRPYFLESLRMSLGRGRGGA